MIKFEVLNIDKDFKIEKLLEYLKENPKLHKKDLMYPT